MTTTMTSSLITVQYWGCLYLPKKDHRLAWYFIAIPMFLNIWSGEEWHPQLNIGNQIIMKHIRFCSFVPVMLIIPWKAVLLASHLSRHLLAMTKEYGLFFSSDPSLQFRKGSKLLVSFRKGCWNMLINQSFPWKHAMKFFFLDSVTWRLTLLHPLHLLFCLLLVKKGDED